jgi:hypothetical protein
MCLGVGQGDDRAADGAAEAACVVVPGPGAESATGWDSGEARVTVGPADGEGMAAADDWGAAELGAALSDPAGGAAAAG